MSMAPETVRMVLVEGENADGTTVDKDDFEVAAGDDSANAGAADQVIAAILGTRESAAEGDHHLASTGVTWTDPVEAAALRDALAAHKVENVMLVSAFLAAAALAQSAGSAVGYAHTGLLFLEPDTATLAIVDTADGSIVDVRRQPMRSADAPAALTEMMDGLDTLNGRPDGVFVVGCGVDVAAIKPQLETATALPVSGPDDPETALARGAALASANSPLFASSTTALAYSQVHDWTTAERIDVSADTGMTEIRAYSIAADDGTFAAADGELGADENDYGRRPFLVALSVMMVFFAGILALVVSLAVAVRPAVSQQPSPGRNLVAPAQQAPAPAPDAKSQVPPPESLNKVEPPAREAQPIPENAPVPDAVPAAPAPAPEASAPAPVHVPAASVPAPNAPAPAPEAPAPDALAPVPAAPPPVPAAPAPVPIAPVPVPVPVPVAPLAPRVPPIFHPPVQSPPSQRLPQRPAWRPGGGPRDRGGWQPGGGNRGSGGGIGIGGGHGGFGGGHGGFGGGFGGHGRGR
ncbi:hypothetical protein A5707_17660 [Mycobacterium kyorinense]|uniref:DUF7159 domain-containing protein n=2 Tax=Mycobacterium kyorinense TaxID=487514 RepID=A0A1A2ZDA7_9MYCO|nr:hypothetical protein [Mycobacterium kyorinense]OBI48644.1 hypothetical protein A5707_17660 [Mycobacterium kyorinense]